MRLKGLEASFHAGVLLALAEEAIASAPGEPTILRKLETFKRDFSTARP